MASTLLTLMLTVCPIGSLTVPAAGPAAAAGLTQPLQASQTTPSPGESSETARPHVPADADRYIGVDELKPGMRGYGLTVFQGSKVERFDVEVVSVLRNYRPKRDAFLIRCHDDRFDRALMVRGVSGSPVYFDGRLAGAMAFGWSLSKDPLYGVTPIAQMLQVSCWEPAGGQGSLSSGAGRSGRGAGLLDVSVYRDLMRPTLLDSADLAAVVAASPLGGRAAETNAPAGGLAYLPMSVSASGLSPLALASLRERIPNLAFDPVLTGAGGAAPDMIDQAGAMTMVPGGTLTVPLVMGDMQAQVLGTVTEVVGNKVYGFGHAWNGEGASNWPMGAGVVHTFVNRLDASFKLGSTVKVVGTLRGDESAAVYGEMGPPASMVPMTITVDWFDRTQPDEYSVHLAQNEQTSPVLAAQAALTPLLDRGGLPRESTVHYEIAVEFDGLESIHFSNTSSSSSIRDILGDVLEPLTLILNNPWRKVLMGRLAVHFTVSNRDNLCAIRSARLVRPTYRPGETVRVIAELQPVRDVSRDVEITLPLPKDLPAGDYELFLGCEDVYRQQLRKIQPHRYNAFSAEDVRRVLAERLGLRRDALYLSMALPGERGLAIEDETLVALPASKAMLLTDSLRKGTIVGFVNLLSNSLPTDYMLQGGTNFQITVEPD